jgi:hypothetical protein
VPNSRDKYSLYFNSVQNPEADIAVMKQAWKAKYKGEMFKVLREDFCGTFANTVVWVKQNKLNRGIAIDLDQAPIAYGKKHYLSTLNPDQESRVTILNENVLSSGLPKADVIFAFNFSYYCFQQRKVLTAYFKEVYKKLNSKGMFLMDCFGGSLTQLTNDYKVYFPSKKYTYHFEQLSFDPINSRAKLAIHFRFKKGKPLNNAFTYDWRMWTIPEVRDLMLDAGFSEAHVYWEGCDADGEGTGEYLKTTEGDNSYSWIAFVVGMK